MSKIVRRMERGLFVLMTLVSLCFFCGCNMSQGENAKVEDLEFVVLSEERIPDELTEIIEEKKSQPFRLTYQDEDYLYVCIGYGEQDTGGYSIAIDDFYLSKKAVCTRTTLLGPGEKPQEGQTHSCPYIVIRTQKTEKPVIFV